MPIDFGILQPLRPPGAEIASITGLLSAFAERRQKQQQEAAEREFRERQFAAQQANIAADNARADQQFKQLQQQHQDAQAAAKAKADDEKAKLFAEKALGPAQSALRNNDLQGARLAVQPYGGDVTQDYTAGEQASAAIADRRAAAADTFAPLEPVGNLLGGIPQIAQAAAAQPTADEARQMAPRYKIQAPVGPALDYSPMDAETGEQAGLARNTQRAVTAASQIQSPYSPRILEAARAQAMAGATPEEAVTRGLASGQFGEQQAESTKRAAMVNARARESHGDLEKDREERRNLRAEAALNQEADKWAAQNGIKELNKAHGEASRALSLAGSSNGPAQVAAVEGFIKAARGGAVTAASQGFATKHLGGVLDSLEGAVEAAKSGKFAPGQMKNLQDGLKAAIGALNEELGAKRKRFDSRFRSERYGEVQANVDDIAEGMFGGTGNEVMRKKGAKGISPTGKRYTSKSGTLDELDAEADSLLGAP